MIVTAITNGEFQGMAPRADAAVLRILDPIDSRDALEQGWGDTLSQAFWDMDSSALGVRGRLVVRLWGRHRAWFESLAGRLFGSDIPWRPFIAADAVEITAFADGLAEKGVRELLVVCRNGRGRSGTVGRWIARRLGAAFHTNGDDRESGHIRETLDRVGGTVQIAVSAAA
ncbi:hypothetical protein CU669_14330 [Paramagnetospirillum kuznetsovii]|uniref:Tyrosine specific protein phosphatases domain-containing protein n=1 Tax=Paramagnetospirillum kuznetsovii TaxID=2053833 RepID=A0A364NWA6_9PROT|nr:hypothetical protein [Paramagnetospirillum kuznetsovii]RAU21342.1 hypothetical protein CU669_14330 [Paramagnetospirillum kuznetsovii]